VPPATIGRARVVVDQRAAAWAEAGDLIQARDAGLLDAASNRRAGRGSGRAGRRAQRRRADNLFQIGGQLLCRTGRGPRSRWLRHARLGLGTEVAL